MLALIAGAEGRIGDAATIVIDARTRGSRVPDAWRFAHAQVLDSLAALGTHHPRQAVQWIADLELVADRGGMRELLAKAQLHRAAIGQRGALETAGYCVCIADDEETVREHARLGEFPANSVSLVPSVIDPTTGE